MTSGLHHLALMCVDMKATVKWYEEALGFKLRSIFPMHGRSGAKHCFLEMGNGGEISFVEDLQQNATNTDRDSPGVQNHLAFRCESAEQLQQLKVQIEATGVKVRPLAAAVEIMYTSVDV